MTQPTREQILKVANAVGEQNEQLLMHMQAQAVVIKDIIDTVELINDKIDRLNLGEY